jgi:hypothetical protein
MTKNQFWNLKKNHYQPVLEDIFILFKLTLQILYLYNVLH